MEELKNIDKNIIIDTFFLDGLEIAVINPVYFESNSVVFAKIVFDGANYVLESLTVEENEKALKKYIKLIKLFLIGDE